LRRKAGRLAGFFKRPVPDKTASLAETEIGSLRENEVIQKIKSQYAGGFFEADRHIDVLRRGLQVP
jgi:hypothetical protein